MSGRQKNAEAPAPAPRRGRRRLRPMGDDELPEERALEAPPERRPRPNLAVKPLDDAAPVKPRLHIGRLSLLVLVLIAAAFYIGPLREFFAQQDRYQQKTAALAAVQTENAELQRKIDLLGKDSYIGLQALEGSMLVEPGTQVFVIKGLPGRAQEDAARVNNSTGSSPDAPSISVLDRLADLWRTLQQ
jgi:cell division protein FtsB